MTYEPTKWHFIAMLAISFGLLASCTGDETLTGYGAKGSYALRSLSGAGAIAATITFPEAGQIAGRASCNAYSARQTAPYPWFQIDRMITTRATCADQAAEDQYLAALRQMREAEVLGSVLILRGEGREMVFDAVDNSLR